MSIKKTIGQILNNRKDVCFEDLEKILYYFGYKKYQPRSGSSHYTFRKIGAYPITIPKHKPVGCHYVGNVIELLNLEEWFNESSKG